MSVDIMNANDVQKTLTECIRHQTAFMLKQFLMVSFDFICMCPSRYKESEMGYKLRLLIFNLNLETSESLYYF